MPATRKWTDEYLKEQCGSHIVRVEKSGSGNYGHAAKKWDSVDEPLSDFIDDYVQETSTKYLSTLLPAALAEDVFMPSVYPGSDAQITEILLWHGKGESNSIIHNDQFDNLYAANPNLLRLRDFCLRHCYASTLRLTDLVTRTHSRSCST